MNKCSCGCDRKMPENPWRGGAPGQYATLYCLLETMAFLGRPMTDGQSKLLCRMRAYRGKVAV